MWRWEDVKIRRCEDEQMWRWADVKMRRCEDEKMWRWEGVKMWRCEDEKMWRWADVKMRRCERRCEDEQMWRWADVKMRRCERRCEDEKVWRWEDEIQTPTIGRTLRSDALGKNIILGISLVFGWRFLHFLTVNCSCYPRESNSLHSEARFSLFFSFSAFFSRRMQQSPFFCRLLFAKKNWNKEAPCNTEKPPLRMETYPLLFWFVFLKFLRIALLHLESLMLIKKWNHNHSEQINIHSEWRQNFTKRMHQPACKMEKYRFWIGKSPCMLSFIFVQVWPKGMKHHLFRTNNFHSAWRFLQFIFEHIDTFLFTMGTNNSPFKCFISTLLSLWLQHLWVGFF